MKKIYLCAAVSVLTVVMASTAFAAQNNSVTVNSGSKNVTLTYPADTVGKEVSENASGLFKDPSAAGSSAYTTDTLTITSIAKNGTNVDVSLRLSLAEAANTEASPLDYYSFVITDQNGEVVYSSEQEPASGASAVTKNMDLGKFNTHFTKDTRTYKVEYKVSEEGKTLSKSELEGLNLELVAFPTQAENSAEIVDNTNGSAEENAVIAEATETAAMETTAVDPTAAPTATEEAATATPNAAATAEPKIATKVVGKDLDAGRYVVKGNANIKIADKDGKLLSETTVIDGSVPDAKGVKQFIVTLNKGDVITISPLEGQDKAPVSFEKTNTGTASGTSAASTAAPKGAASKSNPKTGESGFAVGIILGVMALCGAGFAGLEVMKRRKTN